MENYIVLGTTLLFVGIVAFMFLATYRYAERNNRVAMWWTMTLLFGPMSAAILIWLCGPKRQRVKHRADAHTLPYAKT